MSWDNQPRRSVLKKTGYAVGVSGALAGCLGEEDDGDGDRAGDSEPSDGGNPSDGGDDGADEEDTSSGDQGMMELNFGVPEPNETGIPTWYGLRDVATEFDVDVTLDVLSDTNVMLQAMLSGQTEGSRDSMIAILPLLDQGKDMKYIYTTQKATSYVLVGAPEFETLDDFAEQDARMGAASDSLRSFTTLQVVAVLMENGVIGEPQDILDHIVPVSGYSTGRLTALIEGEIDVSAQHISQWWELQEEHPEYNLLATFGEELDNWLQIGYYTSPDIIEQKEDELVAALKGVITATERINSNYDTYKEQVETYATDPPSDDVLEQSWEFYNDIGFHPEDGGLERERVEYMIDLAQQADIIESDLEYDDVVDTSLVERALDEL